MRLYLVRVGEMKKAIALVASIGVFAVDGVVEMLALPIIYDGIKQFPETGKPIGGILLPAAFLHLLLGVATLISLSFILEWVGYMSGFTPHTSEEKIQTIFLLIFLASGLFIWYYPLALLPFILSGVYLLAVEIR